MEQGTGVLDIAGGRGNVSFELQTVRGIRSVSYAAAAAAAAAAAVAVALAGFSMTVSARSSVSTYQAHKVAGPTQHGALPPQLKSMACRDLCCLCLQVHAD